MASVRKTANHHWQAVWSVVLGEEHRQRTKVFATRREAQDHARQMERTFEVRGVASATELSVGSLAARFLGWCGARLRASTLTGYERNLGFLTRHIGAMPLRRVTPEHLDLAYTALLKGGGAGGKPLHPRTVLHVHRVAHRMLGQAVRWRLIPDNPARLATPPRVLPSSAKAPTIEEAGRLIATARHEPWPQLLSLALASGLRRGELLGLRWADLDLDNGWLTVTQVVEQAGRAFGIRPLPKTRTSARRIGLDPGICDILLAWRARLGELTLQLGLRREEPGALVFPDLDAGSVCAPREPDAVSATASGLARLAGLPAGVAPLHGLRHRHASSLMHLPLRVVADRLGHSTVRITADLYQHGDEAAARAAADAAGAAFGAVLRHAGTRRRG